MEGILKNSFMPGAKAGINSLYFPAILLAFASGLICGALKMDALEKGTAVAERFFFKLFSNVMILTPLGVFSLMAKFTGSFGMAAMKSSGAYIVWAYGGCLLVLGLVMILPLWILCKVNPGQYHQRMARLLLTAVSTCSSAFSAIAFALSASFTPFLCLRPCGHAERNSELQIGPWVS